MQEIKASVQGALYANDLVIFITRPQVKLEEEILQHTVDKLYIWSWNNSFNFSTPKTTLNISVKFVIATNKLPCTT